MKASFPVEFQAVFLGKSRQAGAFTTTDGDEIKYGDAYDLSFDSSEGLAQTCRVSAKQLDEAADFDVEKLQRYASLRVRGDLNVREGGASFRPVEVRQVDTSARKAA